MSGAAVALPVWATFMKKAHSALELEPVDFEIPQGVAQVEVCGDTYQVASIYCPKKFKELFVPGAEPTAPCADHRTVTPYSVDKKDKKKAKREFQF
jgi:penicillin-binding protein 1A